MENNNHNGKIKDQINQNFDSRRFLASIIGYWYWILLSVLVACLGAFLYLRYTTPEYQIKSSLLLESADAKGNAAGSNSMLKKIGIQDEGVSIFNEIMLLRSQDLVAEVVDSLALNIAYYVKGRVTENEIYEEVPLHVVFDSNGYKGQSDELYITQAGPDQSAQTVVKTTGQFEVTYKGNKKVVPFHFSPRYRGREQELRDEVEAAFSGRTGPPAP